MKDYVLKDASQSSVGKDAFLNGLVFGFDVGTGSIGYAVRKGTVFKDVGVVICDSEGSDLSKRRELRRQRRTLRSKKYRRQWFAKELAKLGLPKPENPPNDPISLRLRAVNGDELKPEELHAALTHLFKRRGYSKVPWAKVEAVRKNGEKAKQEDSDTQKAVTELEQEMQDKGCRYPCQLLDLRRKEAGELPKTKWGRNFPWGRQMLEDEFRAIAEAQKDHFPELIKNAEMLLHRNTREITREIDGTKQTFHVFFKTDTEKKPGVIGIRWPKFENRGPGLDALEPFRKEPKTGAWIPQHTLRRDKLLFKEWQLEVALNNFRVKRRLITTGRSKKEKFELNPPPPHALEALRKLWNERGHLWAEDLREWAKNYEGQFELHYPIGTLRHEIICQDVLASPSMAWRQFARSLPRLVKNMMLLSILGNKSSEKKTQKLMKRKLPMDTPASSPNLPVRWPRIRLRQTIPTREPLLRHLY